MQQLLYMVILLFSTFVFFGFADINNFWVEAPVNRPPIVINSQGVEKPIFPGSEGFGSKTVYLDGEEIAGGRGGTIHLITSTSELISCFEGRGPRVCLFTKGGKYTIAGEVSIVDGRVTVIGQTASGSGVVIEGSGQAEISLVNIDAPYVAIQYVTLLARSTGEGSRALSISNRNLPNGVHNVLISHATVGVSEDENTIVWYNSHDVTIEYGLDTVALMPDGKGPLLGRVDFNGGRYSYHHNIIAHMSQRMPRIRTDRVVDVSYNYITAFFNDNAPSKVSEGSPVNYRGNYYSYAGDIKQDLEDDKPLPYYISIDDNSPIFVDETNVIIDTQGNSLHAREVVKQEDRSALVKTAYVAPQIQNYRLTGDELKTFLLSFAGNSRAVNCRGEWYSRRSPFDTTVIAAIREGAHIETDNPMIFAGPVDPGSPCEDRDKDGLPDEFEDLFDRDIDPWELHSTGWSMLEAYANGLHKADMSTATPTATPTATSQGTKTPTVTPSPIPTEPTVTPTPRPTEESPEFIIDWVESQATMWFILAEWLKNYFE